MKISVIILNYNRPHNIKQLLNNIIKYNFIDDIIISHGKKETEALYNHTKVRNETKLRNIYYSATRFELSSMAHNDFILFLDDDILPSRKLLINIINKINNDKMLNKHNLYGPFKRLCNDTYKTDNRDYNIVLTGCAIINKHTAIKVWNKIKNGPFFNELIENKGNGEDLLFSKYIKLFGGENIYVNGKYTFLDNKNGYSDNHNHYKLRRSICNKINNYDYGQIIEKNIFQCYYTKYEDLPIEYKNNIEKIKKENPEYNYRYFTDDDIIQYIKINYNNEYAELYNRINKCYGAAKADLFRYLVIYKEGGVYLDIKSTLNKPLKEIIQPYDEYLLTSWYRITPQEHHETILKTGFGEFAQWIIISRKNHPFLKSIINNCIYNLNNIPRLPILPISYNFYKQKRLLVLFTTGPIMYTKSIMKIINKYNYTFKYNYYNKSFKYSIYNSYTRHRNYNSSNNYHICNKELLKELK